MLSCVFVTNVMSDTLIITYSCCFNSATCDDRCNIEFLKFQGQFLVCNLANILIFSLFLFLLMFSGKTRWRRMLLYKNLFPMWIKLRFQHMNCENANGVNIDCDFIGDTIEFEVTFNIEIKFRNEGLISRILSN